MTLNSDGDESGAKTREGDIPLHRKEALEDVNHAYDDADPREHDQPIPKLDHKDRALHQASHGNSRRKVGIGRIIAIVQGFCARLTPLRRFEQGKDHSKCDHTEGNNRGARHQCLVRLPPWFDLA